MRRTSGFVRAIVVNTQDPDGLGRLQVSIPDLKDDPWIERASFLAGNGHGALFTPAIGDEVLVAYEGGGARRQLFVIGGLWREASPPPPIAAGSNMIQVLKTRSGVSIVIDDTSGSESLLLETPGGQRLHLKDGPAMLEIRDANGTTIRLDTSGVTIESSARVTLQASQINLEASLVDVNAGLAKFDGVVQCQTLIANSVVSASYTPGAGNVL